MRHTQSFLILLLAASPAAAADNGVAQTRALLEIEGLLNRVATAEKVGDAAALAQCYEGDGILLPSSGEPVIGRDEIARRYQAIFSGNTQRLVLESEELWVLDDLAVSRGAARGPAPRHKAQGPIRNRYVMTLKRHGETWEIRSLVWNSGSRVASR
ncbi:MAG: nuclear transport factor 2 family protein [Vicinamibacteria bacterium]|nr:nuclear transport factor 2 family protein [Vicinamibacteria bacterium]